MNTIEYQYTLARSKWSDIYQHIDFLRHFASKCESITECGVRSCVSSWAFLMGLLENSSLNKSLIGVDLFKSQEVSLVETCAKQNSILYTFIEGDDTKVEIPETDLLFIDTWHIYAHLKAELNALSKKARKYIILHDTTVDAINGETIRNGWNAEEQSKSSGYAVEDIKKGIWPAIEEFLEQNSEEWLLHERILFCNGLTILKRR